MSLSSPISAAFRLVFRRPSLPLAEIAWRWSFSAGAWFLGFAFFAAYLGSLPVNSLDRLMLRSDQPALIARALRHIFSGSGFRFTVTGILLVLLLVLSWIVLGSLSRVALVRAAAAELGVSADSNGHALPTLLFLNFLRVAIAMAAILAIAGSIILASSFWASTHMSVAGAGILVGLGWLLAWFFWAFLNWLLSFTGALAPLEHGAFSSALAMFSRKKSAISLIGIVFGSCHLAAFAVAWMATSTALGLSGAVPLRGRVVLVAIVVMAYCALADFFYTGRLVAYVSLLRPEEAPVENPCIAQSFPPGGLSIDKGELILSDVPLLPA